MPGALRPQILLRPNTRNHPGVGPVAARVLRGQGGRRLRGHRDLRGQSHQSALAQRIQGNQGIFNDTHDFPTLQ